MVLYGIRDVKTDICWQIYIEVIIYESCNMRIDFPQMFTCLFIFPVVVTLKKASKNSLQHIKAKVLPVQFLCHPGE